MGNVAIMNVATLMKSKQMNLTLSNDSKLPERNQFKSTLNTISKQQNEQRNNVRETQNNVESGKNEVKRSELGNDQVNDQVKDALKRLEYENAKTSSTVISSEDGNGKIQEKLMVESSEENPGEADLMAKSEEELLNQVAELLQMTTEQLQQMLEKLQLNSTDLFNVNHVMALLMEKMNFSDPTQLLLVNDVTDTMNQMNQLMENYSEQSKLIQKLSQGTINPQVVHGRDGEALDNQLQANLGQSGMNKDNQQQNTVLASSDANSQSFNDSEMMNLVMDQQEEGVSSQTTKSASAFEGILTQVITQKTETMVMNGEIQTITTEVTAKDIFDQIVTAIKVNKTDQSQEVTLQLNPKHLGKVQVSLLHENGGITGKFIVENEAVKELMENGMVALKEHLKAQGIEVTDLKISVKDTRSYFSNQEQQRQAQQQFNQKNSRHLHFKNFEDEVNDMEVSRVTEVNQLNESSSIELQA
ncbi:MAG: flagellar hook-length control protein FliK [Vallitaleaceae bacterium]|nr:flagellar hook-length control protein FliK [Vallitaleaceae bacterium]